jgi:bifunctional DNA-binding transcriptional regulator/antitoxin component of YhaV-PrlF toxin-antitoxin module
VAPYAFAFSIPVFHLLDPYAPRYLRRNPLYPSVIPGLDPGIHLDLYFEFALVFPTHSPCTSFYMSAYSLTFKEYRFKLLVVIKMKNKKEVTVTGKRQITLPIEFCRKSGVEQGQKLEAVFDANELRLRKASEPEPADKCKGFLDLIGAKKGDSQDIDHDEVIVAEAGPRQQQSR